MPPLDKNKMHNIDLVVDRLTLEEEERARLLTAIEKALELSKVRTPFGEPSSSVVVVSVAGKRLFFLSRHGEGHIPTQPFYHPYLRRRLKSRTFCAGIGARSIIMT